MQTTVNKKLLGAGMSLVAVALLLGICIWLLMGSSFSWLSHNKKVNVSGMQVHMITKGVSVSIATADASTLQNGAFSVIDTAQPLDLLDSEMLPGDTIAYSLRIKNVSDGPMCVSAVGFLAPDAAMESARVKNGVSYYFGTQLSVALIGVDGTPLTPAWQPLLETVGGTPQRRDLELYAGVADAVTLNADEEITLTFAVRFVDSGTNQNAYMGFGLDPSTAERCARGMYVLATPVTD